MSGESDNPETQAFLSKMYDYRKKIEIDSSNTTSISNSIEISEGQTLRVLVAGSGVFNSQVLKNTSQHINIAHPAQNKFSSSIKWAGTKISVYFWREDDAGYVFDTHVVEEVYLLKTPTLKISHSNSLFRTQKRNSIRIKMNKAAFLYLVPSNEPSHKLESDPGLKCYLEDLSDTGCAVIVGGKADAGIRVKVQFALDNAPVCMTGTVRSVSYREDCNRTVLRVEAEPLPVETRIHILGEVFGMQKDGDEEELPFRVLESTDESQLDK